MNDGDVHRHAGISRAGDIYDFDIISDGYLGDCARYALRRRVHPVLELDTIGVNQNCTRQLHGPVVLASENSTGVDQKLTRQCRWTAALASQNFAKIRPKFGRNPTEIRAGSDQNPSGIRSKSKWYPIGLRVRFVPSQILAGLRSEYGPISAASTTAKI